MIKLAKYYVVILLAIFISSCGERCKRLDEPRQEYFRSIGNVCTFILATPAEVSIKKDSAALASLEIIVQPEVLDKLDIIKSDTTCEVYLDACFKNQETLLINGIFNEIKEISFSAAGKIVSSDIIYQDSIVVENSGLGDIDLLLSSTSIRTRSLSSGNIILSGETKELFASSSGSGELSAFNLFSDTTRVFNFGSGIIEVFANQHLEVTFFNSTTVKYRGHPESIVVHGEGKLVDDNL